MPGPLLWGPNNTSNNLQNQILNPSGSLLAYNGNKNYINNSSFENQLTSGYSLGVTGTLTNAIPTGSPTFGSGASGNLSIAIETSGQIAGLASLGYVSSAATTAGNMVASDAFTIDIEDQASVLNFSIAYKVISGASAGNFSGTSTSSFGVAIYDVTNSAWIIPVGVFNFIQNSGVGKCTGSFQTSSNGTSYRIVIYNANATTGAITLYFDDIAVGPSVVSSTQGAVDWNGSQTSQSVTANVTDIAFTTIKDSSAAWNGTQYVVPSSGDYLIAGSIVSSTNSSGFQIYVNGSIYITGTFIFTAVGAGNPIGGAMLVTGRKAGDTISLRATATSTVTVGNLGIFQIQASQTSPGANGVVAARAHVSSGASTTGGNPINFDTIDFDTTGSITTGTTAWKFTAPVSGYYQFETNYFLGASGINASMFKNGSTFAAIMNNNANPGAGSTLVQLNAGDTIDFRPAATATPAAIGSFTVAQSNYIGIFLLQGSQNTANSASVNARYFASATTISGSLATVVWTTKDFDSANAMSSGTYAVPVSGKYQVNSALSITGTFALNGTADMQIQKNGTAVSEDNQISGGVLTSIAVNCSDIINCLAGDTIRVQVATSASTPAIISSNSKNFFSIARVGN